jgi:hypothetical protein
LATSFIPYFLERVIEILEEDVASAFTIMQKVEKVVVFQKKELWRYGFCFEF